MDSLTKETRFMFRALQSLGECIVDFGGILLQNPEKTNDKCGNVATGLERTAAYLRGQLFVPRKDLQHVNWEMRAKELEGKTGKELEQQLQKSMTAELEGNG